MIAAIMYAAIGFLVASLGTLVIIPLILLVTLTPIAGEFPTYGIFIILSAMPAAAYSVIFAEEYGADAMLASRIVFISTLISLVTIPLISLSVL